MRQRRPRRYTDFFDREKKTALPPLVPDEPYEVAPDTKREHRELGLGPPEFDIWFEYSPDEHLVTITDYADAADKELTLYAADVLRIAELIKKYHKENS